MHSQELESIDIKEEVNLWGQGWDSCCHEGPYFHPDTFGACLLKCPFLWDMQCVSTVCRAPPAWECKTGKEKNCKLVLFRRHPGGQSSHNLEPVLWASFSSFQAASSGTTFISIMDSPWKCVFGSELLLLSWIRHFDMFWPIGQSLSILLSLFLRGFRAKTELRTRLVALKLIQSWTWAEIMAYHLLEILF